MGRAEGPIETEPWSHNQPSIIFFGLVLWHFSALKSWFQEEARMWKSVPQVRQAHILSTWSQDFWRKKPRFFQVFQQLAKHEPPLQCESFEVHGCLSCKFIKQWRWKTLGRSVQNESTFLERNLHTSRYIGFCLCQKRFWRFDNADWSLRTRKAQNVSASFSTTHSLFCHLLPQFFGGRNSFAYCVSKIHFWNLYDPGTYWRVQKMVEWSLRWYWSILVSMIRSNGCWKLTWSDPMGISGRKTRYFPLQMKPIESWNCSAYHCDNFMVMRGPMVASCSDPGTTTTRQIATGWHHSLTSSVRTYYVYIWLCGNGSIHTNYHRLLDIDISLDVLRMMPTDTKSGCKFHDFWWFPNSKLQISKFMNQASRVWLFGFGA